MGGAGEVLGPGQSDGVDLVPADRDRRGEDVDTFGDLPAPLVTGATQHQQLPRVPRSPVEGGIPVGGDHPIVVAEGGGSPDLCRFLAPERRIRGEPALTLHGDRLGVVGARLDHVGVEGFHLLEGDGKTVSHRPVRAQQAEHRAPDILLSLPDRAAGCVSRGYQCVEPAAEPRLA